MVIVVASVIDVLTSSLPGMSDGTDGFMNGICTSIR